MRRNIVIAIVAALASVFFAGLLELHNRVIGLQAVQDERIPLLVEHREMVPRVAKLAADVENIVQRLERIENERRVNPPP